MSLYPVNINLAGRLCIVVGGGSVAVRKITSLLQTGAVVRVISPVVSGSISDFVGLGEIEWQARVYQAGDLAGAFIVFATTDNPGVQSQIVADARSLNLLCNIADNPQACDFQVPATVRRGKLLLSVSTGGASPALAAIIRRDLEKLYGSEYEILLMIMAAVRKLVVESGGEQGQHKIIFEKLLHGTILDNIRNGSWGQVAAELVAVLPKDVNVDLLLSEVQNSS